MIRFIKGTFRFVGSVIKWTTCPIWLPVWGVVRVLRFCVDHILALLNLWQPRTRIGRFIKQLTIAVTIFPVTPTVASAAAWHNAGQPTTWEGIKHAVIAGFGLA
jgi:hypothetical protein